MFIIDNNGSVACSQTVFILKVTECADQNHNCRRVRKFNTSEEFMSGWRYHSILIKIASILEAKKA
jgi:hypothetical protein